MRHEHAARSIPVAGAAILFGANRLAGKNRRRDIVVHAQPEPRRGNFKRMCRINIAETVSRQAVPCFRAMIHQIVGDVFLRNRIKARILAKMLANARHD
ncbi:MAG: hypothetical protein WCB71_02440, partial [Aestuariivirga sp.]